MENLEQKYKEHSEKAIQEKITYLNMEYEINVMNTEMKKADRETKNMKERMEVVEA